MNLEIFEIKHFKGCQDQTSIFCSHSCSDTAPWRFHVIWGSSKWKPGLHLNQEKWHFLGMLFGACRHIKGFAFKVSLPALCGLLPEGFSSAGSAPKPKNHSLYSNFLCSVVFQWDRWIRTAYLQAYGCGIWHEEEDRAEDKGCWDLRLKSAMK